MKESHFKSKEPCQLGADVVIHIGWHKSASTFLQDGFFPALDVNYQRLGKATDMQRELLDSDTLIRYAQRKVLFEPSAFRKALSVDENVATILSHEELSGHSFGYPIIDPCVTADNLKNALPEARIVAVVRNQLDYIHSLYCYKVSARGHEHRSFKRFIKEEIKNGLLEHIEYHRLIAHYVELFGKQNVLVLPLEILKADSDDFFQKLTDFCNHPPKYPVPQTPKNVSTRLRIVVSVWRPFNAVFNLLLKGLLWVRGENSLLYAPTVQIVYPFFKLRDRYYRFKKRGTAFLNKLLPNWKKMDFPSDALSAGIYARIEHSNSILSSMQVSPWDIKDLGYLISDENK